MRNSENYPAINYNPLTTTSNTPVQQAIALMNQQGASCILVLASDRPSHLVGLLTERDVVRLTASGANLHMPIAAVMTTNPIAITQTEAQDIFAITQLFCQHQIRHLPVVDDQGTLVGLITQSNVLEVINQRHKNVAAEIYHSKDLLESIFNESADAIFLVNPETGLVIDCNQRAVELFEASSKAELINIEGHTLQKQHFTPEEVSSILAEVKFRGFWSRELEYVTKQGKLFWGNLAAKQIYVVGQRMNLVRVTDITECKQAEKETHLLLETIQAIGSIEDINSALTTIVRLIGTTIGWDVGEVWIPADDGMRLEYGPTWYECENASPTFGQSTSEEFRHCSQTITVTANTGLPGRVWASRQPEWIEDVSATEEQIFCRAKILLKAGFGVPILASNRVLAVLVFFKRAKSLEDQRLVKLVSAVATQLGSFIERKQAKIALKKSEQRFRAIFTAMFQFIGLLQPDGILLEANQTALDFAGVDRQEVVGRPFWETVWWTISPATQNQLQDAIARAAKGEFIRYEVDIVGAGGIVLTIDFSLKPMFDETGTVVLLIPEGRDISQHKALERALALREARLNAFFRCAPVGLAIMDDQLRYVQINQPLALINGLSVEDHVGKTVREVLPDLAPTLEPLYQQVLSTGQPLLNHEISAEVPSQPGIQGHWVVSHFPIPEEDHPPKSMGVVVVEITELKQAESALRLMTERLQYLLTSSPAVIYSCKASNDYASTFISDNVKAVLGYEAQEFLGTDLWPSGIHPEDMRRVVSELSHLFEIGHHSHEYRFLHKDGTYRWIHDQLRLIRDAAGNPIELVGYFVDISDRKQTEAALKESEERFYLAVSGTNDGVWDWDLRTNQVYYSPVWRKILGYGEEELPYLASTWLDKVHPDDQRKAQADFQDHIDGKVPIFQNIQRIQHKDGRWVWIEAKGKCIRNEFGEAYRVTGTISDITERQLAEEALRESAQRERALAKAIYSIRQTLDLATIFTATTQELRQAINCDRVLIYRFHPDWSGEFIAESVGSEWVSLMQEQVSNSVLSEDFLSSKHDTAKTFSNASPLQDTYLQATFGDAYSTGVSHLAICDIYKAGFKSCDINLLEQIQARAYIIVPIFCGDQLWGLLATYQNSAPRQWKAAEINIVVQIGNQLGIALQQAELLKQTQKQSAALQQAVIAADTANRAKSEFLAHMSHELRTPLNSILGFTQIMSRDQTLSLEHQQNLAIINQAGKHLLELINDILEMSKIEAGKIALHENSFDLIALLEGLKTMLQLKAKTKGLQLVFEYDSNLPQFIKTDESKLRQVLINLLENAIKFTSEGSVTLRVSAVEDGQMTIWFEVEDTGPGIASEEIGLLFEAFEQTETGRKSQQGTGLGLPISRRYVQLMGGDIRVSSKPSQGSVFTFDIHVSQAEATEIQLAYNKLKVIGLAPNQPQYRILVVDDAPESRLVLVKLFTFLGFQVREAENGQEAVTFWDSWQPHLIWMDMRMPVMDGYEATRQIKAREREMGVGREFPSGQLSQTIIIALSANAFEEERTAILLAGCNDFVGKPFREEILLQKMSQHLGVQYLYEEENSNIKAEKQATEKILTTAECQHYFCQMPVEWVTKLYKASCECNDDIIFKLIDQISEGNTALAYTLKSLAIDFQFERIMELTKPEKE